VFAVDNPISGKSTFCAVSVSTYYKPVREESWPCAWIITMMVIAHA